jgi:hypothetical protein
MSNYWLLSFGLDMSKPLLSSIQREDRTDVARLLNLLQAMLDNAQILWLTSQNTEKDKTFHLAAIGSRHDLKHLMAALGQKKYILQMAAIAPPVDFKHQGLGKLQVCHVQSVFKSNITVQTIARPDTLDSWCSYHPHAYSNGRQGASPCSIQLPNQTEHRFHHLRLSSNLSKQICNSK